MHDASPKNYGILHDLYGDLLAAFKLMLVVYVISVFTGPYSDDAV